MKSNKILIAYYDVREQIREAIIEQMLRIRYEQGDVEKTNVITLSSKVQLRNGIYEFVIKCNTRSKRVKIWKSMQEYISGIEPLQFDRVRATALISVLKKLETL